MICDPTPEVLWENKILLILDFHTQQLINMISVAPDPSSAIAGDGIDYMELW